MHLAQLNVGRLLYPQDDPRVAEFMDNLNLVNGIAERSPGFVWRFTDETGAATNTTPFDDDPDMLINLTVWESAETLEHFVYKTLHQRFYNKRHHWFDPTVTPRLVMWWIPEGTLPTPKEAVARWRKLRAEGPSAEAFGWEGVAQADLWKTARC
ncbi:MAG: DUF3291 domain-containing protein [Hyphomonadaceae bacterium]|nr:DUF3291 domain-containing protein [Hyphomonadaceae bacterium]